MTHIQDIWIHRYINLDPTRALLTRLRLYKLVPGLQYDEGMVRVQPPLSPERCCGQRV